MPGVLALHERDALALDGVGDDDARAGALGLGKRNGGIKRRDVVAVALDDVPAERLPFLRQRVGRHDVVDGAVELDVVAVDDGNEIVELKLRRAHGRLPDGALVELAVAHDGVGVAVKPLELHAERHALRGAEADAERAGRHVDAARVRGRVALEVGVDAAQRVHLGDGEVALLGEDAVEHRRGVALREDKAVLIGVLGRVRTDGHVLKIEHGEDLAYGQRAARVAGLDGVDGLEHFFAERVAQGIEFLDACVSHAGCSFFHLFLLTG